MASWLQYNRTTDLLSQVYMVKCIARVTGANYGADIYLIMLVIRHLLTMKFTQRSSCIGRLQVEKG